MDYGGDLSARDRLGLKLEGETRINKVVNPLAWDLLR
jgi:hypothetical protein